MWSRSTSASGLGARLSRYGHRGQVQVGGADHAVAAGQHRTLQQVAQFAHIARKFIGLQRGQRGRIQPAGAPAAGQALEQKRRQRREVVAPFAQRRQGHVDARQPVIQVEPKPLLVHFVQQPAVGGRYQAHVGRSACGCRRRGGIRRFPARAAAWPAGPAGSRRPRPETACRRPPARTGLFSGRCCPRTRRARGRTIRFRTGFPAPRRS